MKQRSDQGNPARILVLPDSVKNKIAAGEVVEGPSSVVKELMENAIDSGATDITVELSESGLRKIVVRDNGCGIPREDLPLAVREHATSKIRGIEDIERIMSCGFRGEALSSISAISRTTILSRIPSSETGGKLVVSDGHENLLEYAGPPGTTVIVENLFFNVPARKKFLKSPTSEMRSVRQAFLATASAWPEISFTLSPDEGRKIHLPAVEGLLQRLEGVYGGGTMEKMYHEHVKDISAAIEGFLSSPGFMRANRGMQAVYVNRRPVEYAYLGYLLGRAYQGIALKGQHPVAFLFITVDPSLVDVNVHPAKRQVRFFDSRYVDGMILTLAGKALSNTSHRISETLFTATESTPPVSIDAANLPAPSPGQRHDSGPLETAPYVAGLSMNEPALFSSKTVMREMRDLYRSQVGARSDMKYLGTVFGTYIMAERGDQIVIVDFHAAHERVIFDTLMSSESAPERQSLIFPVMKELSEEGFATVQERLGSLDELGFEIDLMPGRVAIVRAVPANAQGLDIGNFLDDFTTGPEGGAGSDEFRRSAFAIIACHSAFRAGDALADADAMALLDEVFNGLHELRCPHGRPFVYTIDRAGFERLFRRG